MFNFTDEEMEAYKKSLRMNWAMPDVLKAALKVS